MYTINTIPHGKCFVQCLCTHCFCIRNLTPLLHSLIQFLIRQQLQHKYHTPTLSMKYSLFISLFCALVGIQLASIKNTIILSVCPFKILQKYCFYFSPGTYNSPKRNWKQCLCKIILEGQTKSIMAFVILANLKTGRSSCLSYRNPCPTLDRDVFLLAVVFKVFSVLVESIVKSVLLSSSPLLKDPGPEDMSSGPAKAALRGDSSTVNSVAASK